MKHVTPQVFFLAKTALQDAEIVRWLDCLGAQEFTLPEGTDAENLVLLAGKKCYNSFVPGLNPNVTRTRTDIASFIDNILSSGHGSVLEHATYTFAIENVSRVFTAELNRHRAGMAISEGSLRFIRFDDLPYWIPLSIQDADDDDPKTRSQKELSRFVFEQAFSQMEQNYAKLCTIWDIANETDFHVKKTLTSMMRRIIGMGVATGGVWTGNIRAIRHICTMRISEAAEEEIAYVFTMILRHLLEQEPNLFGDFNMHLDGFFSPEYKKV